MKFASVSKRLATVGVATALAGGALVGAGVTSAEAASVTNSYTCSNAAAGLGPWSVGLVSDAPGIDGIPSIGAGFDVPAGFVTLTNHFTIPDTAYTTLTSYHVEDLSFPDFAGSFGPNPIGVSGMTAKVSAMTDNGDGTHSFDSNGLTDAFEAPAAGVFDVVSATSFSMVATVPNLGPVPVSCVLADGTTAGSFATITTTKNKATVTGKPTARLTHTKAAKLAVTTAAANQVPTGKIVVKQGTKTLGSALMNAKGKAVVNLGKLKKGKHKVTMIYKGDSYTTAGRATTVLKVN